MNNIDGEQIHLNTLRNVKVPDGDNCPTLPNAGQLREVKALCPCLILRKLATHGNM